MRTLGRLALPVALLLAVASARAEEGPEDLAPSPGIEPSPMAAPAEPAPAPTAAAVDPVPVPDPAPAPTPLAPATIGLPSGRSLLGSGEPVPQDAPTPSRVIRQLLACLAVGLLLGAGIWLLRRTFPTRLKGRPTGLMEVLGRTAVTPKHSVVLLRVGGKVLVVGLSPEGMTTLSEIGEPETVEKLLLKEPAAPAEGFGRRLSGVLAPFRRTPPGAFAGDRAVGDAPPTEAADPLEDEIRALERRVASWRLEDRRPG